MTIRPFHRLVSVVVVLAAIIPLGCVRQVVSVEEVDKMVKGQVPIGSDKQRVKDFVDSLKIDALKIVRDDFHQATRRTLGNVDPEVTAKQGDAIAEFTSLAILRAESDGITTFRNIVICFYLDKQGRLIDYTVKMVDTE